MTRQFERTKPETSVNTSYRELTYPRLNTCIWQVKKCTYKADQIYEEVSTKRKYDIAGSGVPEQLLNEYLGIAFGDEAQAWIKKWGLPASVNSLDEIVKSAESLWFLKSMSDLINIRKDAKDETAQQGHAEAELGFLEMHTEFWRSRRKENGIWQLERFERQPVRCSGSASYSRTTAAYLITDVLNEMIKALTVQTMVVTEKHNRLIYSTVLEAGCPFNAMVYQLHRHLISQQITDFCVRGCGKVVHKDHGNRITCGQSQCEKRFQRNKKKLFKPK